MTAENEHFAGLELEDRVLLSSLATRLNLPEYLVAVGRFVLTRRLGRGGMGTVFEARDPERGEAVALKMLTTHLPGAVHRLKREFRAAADIHHPNLVKLYELDFYERRPYFTMELVEGCDIVARAERHGSSPATERGADLRKLLAPLVSALDLLHTHGVVHGDVKPSNIMVTPDDRVVLLDFGLARFPALLELDHTQSGPGGTPGYMAPELAAGEATAATDWYAFGVLLHVLLTKRLPGPGSCIVEAAAVHGFDDELAGLCAQLLRTQPEARPRGAAILEVLGAAAPLPPLRLDDELVGREAELSALRDLHRAMTTSAGTAAAFVTGPSGIGKSALVRAFVRSLEAGGKDVVLPGRCYERESLPFKALDGIIDSLTRHLQRLPSELVAHLLPRHIHALVQLFPRLREVPAIAASPPAAVLPDRQEVRRCAALALNDLLQRLADVAPLVLWIDDLQWGDPDSLSILREVLRSPDAPRLLLILSHRSEHAATNPSLQSLYEIVSESAHAMRTIDIGPLPSEDGRRFAQSLLSGAHAHLDAIVREGQGHPFFIRELCAAALAPRGPSTASLDQLLRDRIEGLPERARELLSTVALARGPVRRQCASVASGVDEASTFFELSSQRLIRTVGADQELIDTFHDRIREVSLELLPEAQRQQRHRDLARAFEQLGDVGPEAIARHYIEGDAPQAALPWLVRAADLAAQTLANDRAIRLYRLALDIEKDRPRRVELLTKLGDAARGTGRAEEAADAYLEAADLTTDTARIRELERLAMYELLRCGLRERADPVLARVCSASGLHFPKTMIAVLLSLAFHLVWIRLRGFRFTERDPAKIDAQQLERIDACWSISHALGHSDVMRSAVFMQRATRLALRAGEPRRAARAMAVSVQTMVALDPGDSRVPMLVSESRRYARYYDDPYLHALAKLAESHACLASYDIEGVMRNARDAAIIFREHCAEASHDAAHAHLFVISMLDPLGRIVEYRERVTQLLAEAIGRGDEYARRLYSVHSARVALFGDEPAVALSEVDRALSLWSQNGPDQAHWVLSQTKMSILHYHARWADAFAVSETLWNRMRKTMLYRAVILRVQGLANYGKTALALYGETRERRHLKIALSSRKRLSKEVYPLADVFVGQLDALLSLYQDSAAEAASKLERSASKFDSVSMPLWAAAMRVRAAQCNGDAEQERRALTTIAAAGISNPARMIYVYAPGPSQSRS